MGINVKDKFGSFKDMKEVSKYDKSFGDRFMAARVTLFLTHLTSQNVWLARNLYLNYTIDYREERSAPL